MQCILYRFVKITNRGQPMWICTVHVCLVLEFETENGRRRLVAFICAIWTLNTREITPLLNGRLLSTIFSTFFSAARRRRSWENGVYKFKLRTKQFFCFEASQKRVFFWYRAVQIFPKSKTLLHFFSGL